MLPQKMHQLKADPDTVSWGFFNKSNEPVLRIQSGDIVVLETVAHHAGDAPEYMMEEDIKRIYDAIPAEDRGPGVHIITGPIYVEDARPGDVLECRILDLVPRLPYGVNFAANWGLFYDDFDQTEYVTLFKIDEMSGTAQTVFAYEFPGVLTKPGPITAPSSIQRFPSLEGIKVPLQYHLGTAGVALMAGGIVDSNPPGIFGGNIDNRGFGVGASMYYPVQVEGALFAAGDPHFAMGNGEISGTAIEGHLNATIQLRIRNDIKIHNPVLETQTHWMTHAFHTDLNESVKLAAKEMINFLMDNRGLSPLEAYSLLSIAGDFHVTQVVNQEQGVHCSLSKNIFPVDNGGNTG